VERTLKAGFARRLPLVPPRHSAPGKNATFQMDLPQKFVLGPWSVALCPLSVVPDTSFFAPIAEFGLGLETGNSKLETRDAV